MSAETPNGPARVLVVDDHEQNRELAQALLVAAGYEVVLAESGARALSAFEAEPIDLVLLDVMMPELDGFATCRRLRALPSGPDIPIVFLTSLNDLGTHAQALESGADDFLTKPIQRTELLLRVSSLLRIRRLTAAQKQSYEVIRQQRDRLAEVERQREQTTSLIVHDLKNPLAAIVANAGYLSATEALQGDLRESARDILCASLRMNRMVMNLLDLCRSESGALVARITTFDFGQLVQEVHRELIRRLADKQQTLVVAQLPERASVRADPEILGRLLANLVENAMKYSPEHSRIEIAATRGDDGAFTLCIRDEGQGVPASHRERIFEKFVRLDEDVDHARTSRGLGLASCRVAAEAHGGAIWVEDNQPRGAAFWVRLPQHGG